MDWTIISSVAAAIGVLVAGFAAYQSTRIHRQQQALTIAIHEQQQLMTKTIHDQQTLLAQRQLLLPLYGHLDKLADINPSNPVWEDVRNAANILELVAICWEGGLIDSDVLRRVFEDTFMEFYEKIGRCVDPPPNFPADGPTMLRNSPATRQLYLLLSKETAERGTIPPIK